MFSNKSAGPLFSRTRRAMAPISRSQSTSAAIRRSSPCCSSTAIHCLMSKKPKGFSLPNCDDGDQSRSPPYGVFGVSGNLAPRYIPGRRHLILGTSMNPRRRHFLRLAAGAATLSVLPQSAWPQAYPSRPVRIIVGFAAGGPADVLARLISQWLSDRFGQPFVVENRPGAGTNIATEAVVKAAADGYTLLFITAANSINATLYGSLNFNFIRDITPVAGLGREPNVMLLNPAVSAKTVLEFIAHAKANPGQIAMASGGTGAPSHVSGEMFKMMAGVNMVHVPYRGAAPAMTDLLAGQVHVYFGPLLTSIEHIKAGRLRALAVTTLTRSEILPDVPTIGELVPGYEASQSYGLGAPKGTPAEIVDKLNRDATTALGDAKIKSRFAELGTAVMPLSPPDYGRFIADETEKWAKVIRAANLKAE